MILFVMESRMDRQSPILPHGKGRRVRSKANIHENQLDQSRVRRFAGAQPERGPRVPLSHAMADIRFID